MLFDIYMILITSFAVFGVYCFIDMLYTVCYLRKMPKSITILNYSSDKYTKRKVRFVQNTVANNELIFLSKDSKNIYENTVITPIDDIVKYIKGSLFTN